MGYPIAGDVAQPEHGIGVDIIDQPPDQRDRDTDQAHQQHHAYQMQRQQRQLP
jgi:hypothetical protein